MSQDPFPDVVELAAREDAGTQLGMPSHLVHLGGGELPGLAEDRVRHADLADVVQYTREADSLDPVLVEAELLGHHLAVATHRLAVARGPGVALVERLRQAH